MSPSWICRWPEPGPLGEVSKFFGRALERQPRPARFEWEDCEHLPTDFENKVVSPLNLFRRACERTAVLPNPIDVHAAQSTARGLARRGQDLFIDPRILQLHFKGTDPLTTMKRSLASS